ncbi:hypothetical protein Q5741_04760 [Paenibacillus sp. JX-17]|uniref:Ubiquitin-like domain-containing protein n=1 Tax=Paenibacillus lacisoli TaxID=3064525 RepID=A0ABT9CB00_9BACL|nr:hypothetical protein [Paenibacillus sp. JX-17]MDO7905723.1 hypothetical protein [Paenibacillus sp. JX-17]
MILTVRLGNQEEEWFDIECDDECPVEKLQDMLGLRVFNERPREGVRYIIEGKFPEGLWFVLDDRKLLTETGMREGCSIRVQRTFSTTRSEMPVFGSRPLFQQEQNG